MPMIEMGDCRPYCTSHRDGLSYMVFPDYPDLRTASEITFRTKLAY